MSTVVSADGTVIAYDRHGTGRPVVLVYGAVAERGGHAPLAELLAGEFTVFNYDRRGRGDSGDTAPYAVEREIEDLAAVIAEAGEPVSLYGMSSGAALALLAAGRGLPIERMVVHEPPYSADERQRAHSRTEGRRIADLIESGRAVDAMRLFLAATGTPDEVLDQMLADPGMVARAHTIGYDSAILDDLGTGGAPPLDLIAGITVPTLVLAGSETFDGMSAVAAEVADTLPHGRLRVLEGQGHGVAAQVLAPVLTEFFAAGQPGKSA
ncbi:alpha/beta fold hydrolase [Amycolatopsis suaedae]|uniref:Alpha/beta hydrolase n=1 Tax=Amycolatopsis suaedae TaxID=2510978 RepID=A0A4Q7J389_9PSEU|nr:alpha/beta hydrolase [Amycolatopsis suaedae]RZQ61076.1 alpha/beta hydrolase [Amycolatopsis suaedae]